jgi:hypothetical protein
MIDPELAAEAIAAAQLPLQRDDGTVPGESAARKLNAANCHEAYAIARRATACAHACRCGFVRACFAISRGPGIQRDESRG